MRRHSRWIAVVLLATAWLVPAGADQIDGSCAVDVIVAQPDQNGAEEPAADNASAGPACCVAPSAASLFCLRPLPTAQPSAITVCLSAGVVPVPDHPPRF